MSDSNLPALAKAALELLTAKNHRWIDHAWSIYYAWPASFEPAQREMLRDALGKMQMSHTGESEDPTIARCRAVLERLVDPASR